MKPFFKRHRHLLGYLFIVAVAVLAIEFHHYQTDRGLDERDRRSCEQRNILAANQVLVLHTVSILVELEEEEKEHSEFENAVLERQLDRLREALANSGPRAC